VCAECAKGHQGLGEKSQKIWPRCMRNSPVSLHKAKGPNQVDATLAPSNFLKERGDLHAARLVAFCAHLQPQRLRKSTLSVCVFVCCP